jgi:G3E family GTPase
VNALPTLPVTVLTGFLGSGKTTLLQRLLTAEGGQRTAVLINEFGEVGLDHLLVKGVAGSTVLLQNGCICCTVRSDLREGLRDLLDGRAKGEVPPFDRILIETTGLADPVPLVRTFVADPMLRNRLRLSHLVATVDALNGLEQIEVRDEALRQAATADRLVITKTDLCTHVQVERLEQVLFGLNPAAPIVRVPGDDDLWERLLGAAAGGPEGKNIRSRFGPAEGLPAGSSHASVRSFVFRTSRPIDWTPLAVWLSLLVHRHGRQILRVKGLLDVPRANGPIWLNAVQHFVHPPVHLDGWPSEDRTSRLVFIVQDLEEAVIRASLDGFLERAGGHSEVNIRESMEAGS